MNILKFPERVFHLTHLYSALPPFVLSHPSFLTYFASKMGNRCSDVLKHVKYIRQKQRPVATDFVYYYSSKEIGLLQPFFFLLPFLKISFLTPVLPLKPFLMMNTGSIEGADIFLRSCVFDGFCFLKAVTFRLYLQQILDLLSSSSFAYVPQFF